MAGPARGWGAAGAAVPHDTGEEAAAEAGMHPAFSSGCPRPTPAWDTAPEWRAPAPLARKLRLLPGGQAGGRGGGGRWRWRAGSRWRGRAGGGARRAARS